MAYHPRLDFRCVLWYVEHHADDMAVADLALRSSIAACLSAPPIATRAIPVIEQLSERQPVFPPHGAGHDRDDMYHPAGRFYHLAQRHRTAHSALERSRRRTFSIFPRRTSASGHMAPRPSNCRIDGAYPLAGSSLRACFLLVLWICGRSSETVSRCVLGSYEAIWFLAHFVAVVCGLFVCVRCFVFVLAETVSHSLMTFAEIALVLNGHLPQRRRLALYPYTISRRRVLLLTHRLHHHARASSWPVMISNSMCMISLFVQSAVVTPVMYHYLIDTTRGSITA
jgi:hypothetical protein